MTDAVQDPPPDPATVRTAVTFVDVDGNVAGNQLLTQAGLDHLEVPAGCTVHVGDAYDWHGTWFDNGVPVAYSAQQALAKLARPPHAARWDNLQMAWVDLRDLEQVRADKWAEIKAAREAAEYGGFTWDASRFDSDAVSQARIQGAVQLANIVGAAFSIDWTLADNTVRTLSAADLVNVGVALGQHVQAQFATARTLRGQIDAATTVEAALAIAW